MRNARLHRVLVGNAAFSGVCGALALIFAGVLQSIFGSPPWLFRALGVGLIVFSMQILWTLHQGGPRAMVLAYFTISDLLWVAGSALLIAFGIVHANVAVTLVVGAAFVVLAFALLQLRFRAGARD